MVEIFEGMGGVHGVELTAEQQAAVHHLTGPCIVVAGPGSGKTRVLTLRIANLIRTGVAPGRILAVTFTRAAANEMKQRVAGLVGAAEAGKVGMYTLHGWAFALLKQQNCLRRLLEDHEVRRIVRGLMQNLKLNADDMSVDGMLTDVARFAGTLSDLKRFVPESCAPWVFGRVWSGYQAAKREGGSMDFDDLLLSALETLITNPMVAKEISQSLDQIMVDEFQDTNPAQWELIKRILGQNNNLFVVGDEDQSVYAFRGAEPRIMVEVVNQLPGCKQICLGRNFRSTEAIVGSAATLIARNTVRFPKALVANQKGGTPPLLFLPASSRDEAEAVIARIQEELQTAGGTVAVLYRTNLSAMTLVTLLDKAKIRYQILGGRPTVFGRWMVKDCLSWIRWAWGEATGEEARRLLQRPVPFGVARNVVFDMKPGAKGEEVLIRLQQQGYGLTVRQVGEKLQTLRTLPANQAIMFILNHLDYARYIREYCARVGTDEAESREVLDAVAAMGDAEAPSRQFLDLAAKERQQRARAEKQTEPLRLTLSTFHSAKGLEWDTVFIINAVEGVCPSQRALKSVVGPEAALEEERRLFYVGVTRAARLLEIYAPQSSGSRETPPSRFLEEAGLLVPA